MYDQAMYANQLGPVSNEEFLAKQEAEYQPPTARKQLLQKQAILTKELLKVEAALKALDANPDLEQFTEVLKAALR
jgi:hypothetical protein